MSNITRSAIEVLDNHRPFVFNVGDIFRQRQLGIRNRLWGKRRIPLGAYFTTIFEEHGILGICGRLRSVGQIRWRSSDFNGIKMATNPDPLYQYPVNCYEHIFVFYKHRLDETPYPCPICGCLKVNGNAYSRVGVKFTGNARIWNDY